MSKSLNLITISNVPVKIHWSFWLIVLWIGSEGFKQTGEWQGIAFAIVPLLLFFVCVILHELGHAFAAKMVGVKVKNIILWPFGGMTQIQQIPQWGTSEFIIAIAGPLINLLAALVLSGFFFALWGNTLVDEFLQSPTRVFQDVIHAAFEGRNIMALVAFLVMANIVLGVFNLVPAFPMDGGRILRALLSLIFPFNVATRSACRIGQLLAIIGIILPLVPYLGGLNGGIVLIAAIIFIGATYEDKLVQRRWILNTTRVSDVAFATTIPPVFPRQSLKGIAKQIFNSPQHDAPVISEGKLVGMLRRDDLLQAVTGGRIHQTVAQIMRTDCPSVSLADSLQTVKNYITTTRFTTLPILEKGQLLGLINLHDVNETYERGKG